MPCRSDYLEPTYKEQENQRVAKLLVYVLESTSAPVTEHMRNMAGSIYANTDFTPQLCDLLKTMRPKVLLEITGQRTKISRDLANWWEDHQEADRRREAEEQAKTKMLRLRESAYAKMTEEERKAFGL